MSKPGRRRAEGIVCGMVEQYWRGCRCAECRKARAKRGREIYWIQARLKAAKKKPPVPHIEFVSKTERMVALAFRDGGLRG